MDFTLSVLRDLLTLLRNEGYSFMTVTDYVTSDSPMEGKHIVLRHDVDKKPVNSLVVARIESELGIKGTYYFRIVQESLDKDIAVAISSMGHEVGYHYEDLNIVNRMSIGKSQKSKSVGEAGMVQLAYESFGNNLERMREIIPVSTICMHGSPVSRHDSRLMWKYYDYREKGVYAEPYFDIPLEKMLYLTDTGRRWNGSGVSVRDRVYKRKESYYTSWVRKPVPGSAMSMTDAGEAFQDKFRFRKTSEISGLVKAKVFPDAIALTLHPQRWSDSLLAWMVEFLAQNSKNQLKYFISRRVRH